MDKTTLEEELLILEQGINTPFWQLLTRKWNYFITEANKDLLNPACPNREFTAGKVLGMISLLNYPEKHIKTSRNQLKDKTITS